MQQTDANWKAVRVFVFAAVASIRLDQSKHTSKKCCGQKPTQWRAVLSVPLGVKQSIMLVFY